MQVHTTFRFPLLAIYIYIYTSKIMPALKPHTHHLTGYHLLRRHPSTLTTDQMKRYLRKARTYQLTEYGKAEISLELAGFMAEKVSCFSLLTLVYILNLGQVLIWWLGIIYNAGTIQ